MESILKHIGLERVVPAFEKENITPDIVCKMSLYDMRCVGLSDTSEIMKLRTACMLYGSSTPCTVPGIGGGAPCYDIPKESLEGLICIGFKISEIAHLLGVSESTVYRRMRVFGLKKLTFSDIGDEELTSLIQQTIQDFPKCGERMLAEILRQNGVHIQRYRLRDILHEHDEPGIKERQLGRLHRRTYHVQGPNHMWHVDTNHKLIRWGFVISGAIDGFSRLVTALRCLDNNRSDSLLQVFREATETFGTPRCVRTDQGMENIRIAEFMFENRGAHGILTGKSTHNQRIERLWRDVYDGVLVHYYLLFSFMEDEDILDALNPIHLFALHYVYKDKINEKLDIWREAWASHRLRTVRSSPNCLWASGILKDGFDAMDQLHLHENEFNQPLNETPIFQLDIPDIRDQFMHRLTRECPRNWVCPNFGINVYQKVLRIVT
ncbi:uncharacterized protein LOC123541283 [Mercenaria mercenaria]|uniref:uncharacterized protein LOC123541283 n=1 Tax=Mercenaria mercenaria TaxID=6596 RepID=UPI00234F85CE|nr:uncharacterized protein LOC123541283 [Mercenaria mercenaria]